MIQRLESMFGRDAVAAELPQPWKSIDGIEPKAMVYPSEETQAAEALRICSSDLRAVVPSCNGHAIDTGPRLSSCDLVLNLSRMKSITYFEPEDLVVSAQAGVNLEELREKVEEHGLVLPIWPPLSSSASVSGAVSLGNPGPLSAKLGSMRDNVLGARAVLSDGTVFTSGGRVVKNVAGYDLTKLLVGTRGTLGVITEVTFRLKPAPRSDLLLVTARKKWLWPALDKAGRLLSREVDPTGLCVFGHTTDARIGLCLSGEEEDVAKRKSRAMEILGEDVEERLGREFPLLQDLPWKDAASTGKILARVTDLPSRLQKTARLLGETSSFFIDMLSGRIHASMDKKDLEPLGKGAKENGAWLSIEAGPRDARDFASCVLFTSREEERLCLGLKKSLDPRGILSPGRLQR